MRSLNLRKGLITLMTGGLLFAEVSCIPNRDQINQMLNTSILQGISLAITLGIQNALTIDTGSGDDTTDETADETAT